MTEPARSILVVDDAPDSGGLTRDILACDGYECILCSGAEEALATLETEEPLMVITDAIMPGMDGFELASSIRKRNVQAPLPILLQTGLDDSDLASRCAEAGIDRYIVKGISMEPLRRAVAELAGNSGP